MKRHLRHKARVAAVACAAFLPFSLGACTPVPDVTAEVIPEARAEPVSVRWTPSPSDSWQWQLSGALDLTVDADVYDVDYETATQTDNDTLKENGRHSICYLSVGSWEDFRGDAEQFPETVLGNIVDGWPDERWLDIRRTDVLLPIMAARMDTCAAKGFDAVEPDNVDGYVNETGFPLTADDQVAYNRSVAELAHARGLSVGLKNDIDQIPELADDFDFAVNEECFRYGECEAYKPFADEGKAVLHVEYQGPLDFCAESRRIGLSSMLKPLDLGPARSSC
ncbi:endo alpha-1,4 polygalactosaminidase [Arthrobacter sunyaminii]|uniref:Endo alpha-1,4 polygalactosaminidase n=1 Tax=Arthrobacter sunyaminii TaxID=2816859 RepID=A0A975S7S5_9MICC|nr:endo alpha-1,4 polygalactosaminidase [Arthrobacter sunyaminii]MBO0908389.1 endo alpha-1,4 polygalactosaminidase [Arthrobacter sunyaminii]QWQ37369.1 endo alpha-1,4 polygalactosaminidase [Arthrobacter sunyaminii]